MRYSIVLARTAAERILRFQPSVYDEVVEQLDRLGEDPRLATRIALGPLEGRMAFTFVVGRPPGAWRFTVLFLFSEGEDRIVVTDFGVLRGDPPVLEEPVSLI